MIEQNIATLINGALNLIAVVLLTTLPIIAAKVVIYVKAKWLEVSRNQPEYIRTAIEGAAIFGIRYAQQKFTEDTEVRKEKLDEAIKVAKEWLATSGIDGVDTTTLEHAIESLIVPTKLEIKQQKAELNNYKLFPDVIPSKDNVTVNVLPVTNNS